MQENFEDVLPANVKQFGDCKENFLNLTGLFFNPKRKKLPAFATNLAARLASAGFPTVSVYEKDKNGPFFSQINALLVLGGDGTVLDASGYAIKYDIPLLCVNLGKVGYLSEIEPDMLDLLD